MALAANLDAALADIQQVAGRVTWSDLVEQLKAAIAIAQAGGQVRRSYSLPTGVAVTFDSMDSMRASLAQWMQYAAEEGGALHVVQVRLA
jgi:hypothetical protein